MHFADLVKDAKSVAGFSAFANFKLDEMGEIGCQVQFQMQASKVEFWASLETDFFGITGT